MVVRPLYRFDGKIRLLLKIKPASAWPGGDVLAVGGDPITVSVAAPPGARMTVTVEAGKKSPAVPTIVSVLDADGNELLVASELKEKKKSATLKMRTRLAGGDITILIAPRGANPGDVVWKVKLKLPRTHDFAMLDVPAGFVVEAE